MYNHAHLTYNYYLSLGDRNEGYNYMLLILSKERLFQGLLSISWRANGCTDLHLNFSVLIFCICGEASAKSYLKKCFYSPQGRST